MTSRWAEDQLHRQAKKEGYRSRAAYKLREIQKRHHIFRKNDSVVDLGAAPGSWLQVARSFTQGRVVGVDLNPILPLDMIETMVGDFTKPEIQDLLVDDLGPVSVVLCDAAPHLTGHRNYDQAVTTALGNDALICAIRLLKQGGNFVIKGFQGDMFEDFLAEVKKHFMIVHLFRPQSTRKGSTEIYLIGKNFKG
ncbi:MAG: RlmE family RNA methyltransferase [Methanomicrobiales archaeon]|nr:RlmE family RNA methyltransferase [Methanomicrobiales archaeon]